MAKINQVFGVWDRGKMGSKRKAKDRLVARYSTRREAEAHMRRLHNRGRIATWGKIS